MYANLVRSAGFQLDLEQRVLPVSRGNTPVGHGVSAALHNRHTLAIDRVPRKRCVDGAFLLANVAVYERRVAAVRAVVAKLIAQRAMSFVIFCDYDETRCHAVDAVHDSRAQLAADAGKVANVIQQRIDQRSAFVPRGRMHNHSLGLVDHEQIHVFVDHVQRNILRQNVRLHRIGECDVDEIACCRDHIWFDRFPVEQNRAIANQALRLRTRKLRLGGNKRVEP